jgi:hypothetical protein
MAIKNLQFLRPTRIILRGFAAGILASISVAGPLEIDWDLSPTGESPPVSGLEVWRKGEDAETKTVAARLKQPLSQHGCVGFWFHPEDDYRPGMGVSGRSDKILSLPGLFEFSITSGSNQVTLMVRWAGDEERIHQRHIRAVIPSLPGNDWIHVAVTWDGQQGLFNLLLNGTAFYKPDTPVEPMHMGSTRTLVLGDSSIPIAGVEIDDAYRSPAIIRNSLDPSRKGTMDTVFGTAPLPAFDPDQLRDRLLYHNSMASEGLLHSWVLEGPGIMNATDGWLSLRSERPDGPIGHVVLWCQETFPESFLAEWDFVLEDPIGLTIVFFAARGSDNRDLFDPSLNPRDGDFQQYIRGDIDSYHISYYARMPFEPRSMANLRKNSGFHLLANGPIDIRIEDRKIYRAALLKEGGRIRMSVDGHTIIDYLDDGERFGPVHGAGKIGLRQMQWTRAQYRNFRVSSIY